MHCNIGTTQVSLLGQLGKQRLDVYGVCVYDLLDLCFCGAGFQLASPGMDDNKGLN